MFCLQGSELGKGGSGYRSESGEVERVVRWAAETDSRMLHPGRGSAVSRTRRKEAVASANAFSGGGGTIFPGTQICSHPRRCPDRSRFCRSHVSGDPKLLFASVLGVSYPSADIRPRLTLSLLPVYLEPRGRLKLRPGWGCVGAGVGFFLDVLISHRLLMWWLWEKPSVSPL